MNCIKCNQEIPEGSRFCPHCGAEQIVRAEVEHIQPETGAQDNVYTQPGSEPGNNTYIQPQYQNESNYQNNYQNNYQSNPYQQPGEQPVNWVPYLVLSIISTICCCLPFGIVGIVFSAKINTAVNTGNMEEARRYANTARIWIIVAVVCGIVSNLIWFVLMGQVASDFYYYY